MKKIILTISAIGVLCFGFNVFAVTTKTINYLNGNYGIGTTTPEALLDVAGEVIAERYRSRDGWHAYEGFQDENETISIGTQNIWYHITNGTNDLWTGLEADGMTLSGDIMMITNAGDYDGTLSMSFTGLPNKDFQLRVYNVTQATQTAYYIGASTNGTGNFTEVSLALYLEAEAGDQFRMEVRNITDTADPTFKNAIFTLKYLHD